MSFYKSIFKLGVPIMVGQVGIIVVGFVDTMMVGRYTTDSLAAASFVNTVFALINMLCLGFSYGLTPIIASFFAQGNAAKVGEALKNGIILNLLFAVFLTVVSVVLYLNLEYLGQPESLLPLIKPYFITMIISIIFVSLFNVLRQFSDGISHVSITMWILLIGNCLNIIFNYFLIFGKCGFPEMGLLGAGISTLGSRIFMAATFVFIFLTIKRYDKFRTATLKATFNKSVTSSIFRTSWPVALQMGLETGFFTISGIMIGWIGAVPMASHQIMVIIGMLGFIIYYSFAASMTIIISQNLGMKDYEGVKAATRCGYHIILMFAILASLTFIFFGEQIIGIFTTDKRVIATCITLIVPLILYQLGDATQITYSNAMRGICYVVPMTYIAFTSYIVIGLPATYIIGFTLNGGIVGIYLSFSIGLFLAALLYSKYFYRRLKAISNKSILK